MKKDEIILDVPVDSDYQKEQYRRVLLGSAHYMNMCNSKNPGRHRRAFIMSGAAARTGSYYKKRKRKMKSKQEAWDT